MRISPTDALLACVVVFAVAASYIWTVSRARTMLNDWADQNLLRIVEARYCWIAPTVFFWTTSKNQAIFRIRVNDRQNQTYEGWARCGSYWGGLLQNKVEVRWKGASPDDEHWKRAG